MPRSQTIADSLLKLFDNSSRPLYVVDAQRRIAYCNQALATWIDLEPKRIIGRRVEFHSEEAATDKADRIDSAPITDLCPPPRAMAGEGTRATVSCQERGGRMRHRSAEFMPLGSVSKPRISGGGKTEQQFSVLVLLDCDDLLPEEVAAEISGEPTADELHRTIRRFRRGRAERYSIQSLLGSSSAMKKVRSQVEAAAASGANTLIIGAPGSGRSHLALAIHYQSEKAEDNRIIPLDCEQLTDELLGDVLHTLRASRVAKGFKSTLLLENLEWLSATQQQLLLGAIHTSAIHSRIIATMNRIMPTLPVELPAIEDTAGAIGRSPVAIQSHLLDAVSTMRIRVPRLVDRLEDLPVLAQYFLEACNRNNSKQVGSIQPGALDSLAIYSWPGELDQLRETIEAAHAACTSHELSASDLPATFFHAFRSASRTRKQPEPIVLDELLAAIEKEAIVRALAQAGGNKSEAATLLGMTRPRLYRRLVQLGLVGEETGGVEFEEAPEFVEQDPAE